MTSKHGLAYRICRGCAWGAKGCVTFVGENRELFAMAQHRLADFITWSQFLDLHHHISSRPLLVMRSYATRITSSQLQYIILILGSLWIHFSDRLKITNTHRLETIISVLSDFVTLRDLKRFNATSGTFNSATALRILLCHTPGEIPSVQPEQQTQIIQTCLLHGCIPPVNKRRSP